MAAGLVFFGGNSTFNNLISMDSNTKKKIYVAGAIALGATAAGIAVAKRRSIPKGIIAMKPFDIEQYLGNWYEIARFNYRFEKGLDHTTAIYTKNEDNSIQVVNRGYDRKKEKWVQDTGKAKFAGKEDVAMLKVSFFGPFYAGYNVIAIDADYKYAMVAGKNRGYLWILSREKKMPAEVKRAYLAKAEALGFKTKKLVWTAQG